jgi:hypothetical protein
MNDAGEVVAVVTAMSNQYGCTFELSYPLPTARDQAIAKFAHDLSELHQKIVELNQEMGAK